MSTNSTADFAAELDANLGDAWRREPGEKLIGEVVDIAEHDAGWGPYPVVSVRRDDGVVSRVHCFHSVLKQELVKAQPEVGETVGIVYDGEREAKDGRRFHSYRLRVKRDRPSRIDWARYADAADVPATDVPEVNLEPTPRPTPEQSSRPVPSDDDIPF